MNEKHFFPSLKVWLSVYTIAQLRSAFKRWTPLKSKEHSGEMLLSVSVSTFENSGFFPHSMCAMVGIFWRRKMNFTSIVYEHAQLGPITKPKGKNKHGERWYTSRDPRSCAGLHIFSWQDLLETFIFANLSIAVAEPPFAQPQMEVNKKNTSLLPGFGI